MSLKCQVVRTKLRLRYHRHYQNHRIGGPAIIWIDGEMFWCLYGKGITI